MACWRLDVLRRGKQEGLVDKKPGSPESTPGAVATMMMMAPPAPYDLCLRHRASFKTRPIALGAIHHRRAAAVGAGDDDAEKMLTLMK